MFQKSSDGVIPAKVLDRNRPAPTPTPRQTSRLPGDESRPDSSTRGK